ncbi:hypothetical protein IU468_09270 [Nocardia farcinica]|uniref:CorA family divalent cation transporter n=1 Tax=Nocardia farcinica TaxID=37329 RepID=UPI001894C81A|nr:CorA family divalent cation transporter [Nocardia farcinica]MBF6256511.1 hypothetical protein [Nocardia farcinica]
MTKSLRAPADRFDTEVLGMHWIPLPSSDEDTAAVLRERLGVDFTTPRDGVTAQGDFTYLPVTVNYCRGERVERETVVFALGTEFVVTLQPAEPFLPFETAIAAMRRDATLTGSSYGVTFALLWALNDASDRVLRWVDHTVEAQRDILDAATAEHGNGLGAGPAREVIHRLGAAERVVARVRETQAQLAAAARHLDVDYAAQTSGLGERIGSLVADIEGVARRAEREHDGLRFLAQTATACLGVRQSGILRLHTGVVAVFLPPTVLAASYAAEFTWLPRLDPIPALFVFVVVTALAAAVPLHYLGRGERRT